MACIVVNCDTCGAKIEQRDSYLIFSTGGTPLRVCRDCKRVSETKGPPSMVAGSSPAAKTARERPTGIIVLACFQIIATIIVIGFLAIYPIIVQGETAEILGEQLYYLLIIDAAVMTPLSLILTVGLLKGLGWARSYSRIFQIINIVSTLLRFNPLGLILPVAIFYYLGRPQVIKFFDQKTAFSSRAWPLAVAGCILLLVMNCSLAVYTNPVVQHNIRNDNLAASSEARLLGTWQNTDESLVLSFSADHACAAVKANVTYLGTWSIEPMLGVVDLNWSTPLILVYPADPPRDFPIEQAYLVGETLSLYAWIDSPSLFVCSKIS